MSPLLTDATGNNLTFRIIGAAMEVHNAIGPGFKEEVYERALEIELIKQDIGTSRQHRAEVHYDGHPVAVMFLDLFVCGEVVVEIKAFSQQLGGDEIAQVINYMNAVHAPVGLLFNFGRRKLEWRRVLPPQKPRPVERLGRDNVKRRS
jgi:GxxExxY protein